MLVKVESASYHQLTGRLRKNRVGFQGEIIPPFLSFHLRGTVPQPALSIPSESPSPPRGAMHTQASLTPFNRAQAKALPTQAMALHHHLGYQVIGQLLRSSVVHTTLCWARLQGNPFSGILSAVSSSFPFFLVTASAASVVRACKRCIGWIIHLFNIESLLESCFATS